MDLLQQPLARRHCISDKFTMQMRGLHLGQAIDEEAILEGSLDELPGISCSHVHDGARDVHTV